MPLDPTRIRALCFDVDGTLCDTDDLWVQKFERILHPLRGLFPQRQVRPFARWTVMGMETPGNLMYYFLDRYGLDGPLARTYNFIARRQANRPGTFLLIASIQEMLAELSQRFPMAVVSARDQRTTLEFLETFGLRSLFRAVATSQTCEHTKPFPDPIFWAARQMGVEPGECLMIGDTTVDINAGKAAGAQTVGVLCGFGTEPELRRAGADLVLPSTADLLQVFAHPQQAAAAETISETLTGVDPIPALVETSLPLVEPLPVDTLPAAGLNNFQDLLLGEPPVQSTGTANGLSPTEGTLEGDPEENSEDNSEENSV